MNATAPRTRDAWLKRMQQALRAAVPGFESLTIETDAAGRPHLEGYSAGVWSHFREAIL